MLPKDTPKIALVIRRLAGRSGGAERVFTEFANLLSEHGYDVSCLTFDKPDGRPFNALNPEVSLINLDRQNKSPGDTLLHIAYKLIPGFFPARGRVKWRYKNGRFVDQLRRYIDSAKPDLLISFLPPANTPTLVAAEDRDVKVIVTNHNVPKEDYESPLRWDSSKHDRALRLSMLDRADAIQVLFPGFKDWFPAKLQERLTAIPNFVSDDIIQHANPGNTQRRKVILGIGRIAPVKNYFTLLDAWKALGEDREDWEVHIYGVGPHEGRLKKKVAEYGLEGSFKLCGATRNILPVYESASIICHPALFEGFGLAPAEALACGVPVVAFRDTPGISEFLKHDHNAWLASREGDSAMNLAAALRIVMHDASLRERLSRNGPGSVSQFSKGNYLERWTALIDSLIGRKGHDNG